MSGTGNKGGFVIFSQDGCGYCTKAKQLLLDHGFAYEEINLSLLPAEEKKAFIERFEPMQRTVPKVYYNGVLIGGHDDLVAFLANPLAQIVLQGNIAEPIYVERLSPTAILPTRGTEESIGLDLYADLGIGNSIVLVPNEVRLIKIGWAMQAPRGHYLRIAPRSGLAFKGAVDVLGGVVDRDYRDVVGVLLTTHGYETRTISHGERIAQIIAEAASIAPVIEVKSLGSTSRVGGFGSTGA